MGLKATMVMLTASAAFASTALAASAGKDPTQLILRKADMPAGASYDSSTVDDTKLHDQLVAEGVQAEVANYLGATYSKTKGFLQISGVVYATGSATQAQRTYALFKKQRDAFWKRSAKKLSRIPVYGTQQFARHSPAGAEGIRIMELIVRKNTVVWLLNVKLERRPPLPKATLLAELKKYALKQKRRIGSG
jgi:hypothetical protein